MGRDVQWHSSAWDEYCQWQSDKATLKRINALIRDIQRDPFHGIGKPEPLRFDLSGLWSRRINDADRLTYCLKEDTLVIVSCKGHYSN